MKPLSETTFCVLDGGLFLEVALRLARDAKRVLYQCTIDSPYPKVNEAVIGDGFDEIERIDCWWPHRKEIDAFVFPDCFLPGMQMGLVDLDYPVWGSKAGCNLENRREMFKELLHSIGLKVAPYQVCVGVRDLAAYLSDKEDKWIKTSKYRGNHETAHWINRRVSQGLLTKFAAEFGSVGPRIRFIVEDAIEAEIEWGYDGYFAGGDFPGQSAHGPEIKDKVYIGSMVKRSSLPPQIVRVIDSIGPVLAQVGYANAFSAEVRIDADGVGYFTDPTCRFPLPAGASQLEFYDNFSDIVRSGANGILIDPAATAKFSVECALEHKEDKTGWRDAIVPDEIRRWVKLISAAKIAHEVYTFPPFPHSSELVGTILGQGDSIQAAYEHLLTNLDGLGDQPISAPTFALADALKEIQEAEAEGVELSKEPVPEPAMVVES